MFRNLAYGAYARPRKPVMTAIADAINRGETARDLEAVASVCATSSRCALRLAAMPGHEKASSRYMKGHQSLAVPGYASEYGAVLQHGRSTSRSVLRRSCSFVCGERRLSCRGVATSPKGEREDSAWAMPSGIKPKGESARSYRDSDSCAAPLSWSRVSACNLAHGAYASR